MDMTASDGVLKSYLGLSDLLGLSRLALDGARTITNVVEDVHASIAGKFVPFDTSTSGHTFGIPGLVYRSIRAGYDVAGLGVQAAQDALGPAAEALAVSPPERERALAILNGVWGDHLEASGNPLAIPMALRHEGAPLAIEADAIRTAIPAPGNRLLLLVHGLCMNDLGWRQGGRDLGAELAGDGEYTPLYLHYNSGLHVSTNGKRLADLLERLVGEWPETVDELTILGYSMGGLLARSAIYYGAEGNHKWPRQLRRLICLGTPHHGSRLERAGSRADALLNATRYSAPFRRLGTTRSAGITDLRHGSVTEEDWQGWDRFGHRHDTRCPAPLPSGVQCFALGATLGSREGDVRDRLLGDGFVPLKSALGMHENPEHCLAFPESNQWVGYGMSHIDLLRNPEVSAKMREWLAG